MPNLLFRFNAATEVKIFMQENLEILGVLERCGFPIVTKRYKI